MQTRELIIPERGYIELYARELDENLAPTEALVEAEYSIVSAGTTVETPGGQSPATVLPVSPVCHA